MATEQQQAIWASAIVIAIFWIGVILIIIGILTWLATHWKVQYLYYANGIPYCPSLIPAKGVCKMC